MAEIFIILYYTYCYCVAANKGLKVITLHSLLFSFSILFFVFGEYFLSLGEDIMFNFYLFLIGWGYFFLQFFLYSHLRKSGVRGALHHAVFMCFLSSLSLMPPLNPLILLYPYISFLLPSTEYPILNLFILYVLPSFIFCDTTFLKKTTCILFFFTLGMSFSEQETQRKNLRMAIVQVGLYFKLGGDTSTFFPDLISFLDETPNIDIIVFSENSVFTYKDKFNENLSEKLLSNIYSNKLNDKFHFFIGFKGFENINNIVTAYINKNKLIINQKRVLIPFVEKEGVLNSQTELHSDYFYLYRSIINRDISIDGKLFKTAICYDSLFPLFFSRKNNVVIVQSNYHLLDRGYGYSRLLKIGGILSKFSDGVKSQLVVNIQDEGGTIVIYNKWNFDNAVFRRSLSEPFLIIDF